MKLWKWQSKKSVPEQPSSLAAENPLFAEDFPLSREALRDSGMHRWSTTFLMAGSALVGATAIALWNRRTISHLRTRIEGEGTAEAAPGDHEMF